VCYATAHSLANSCPPVNRRGAFLLPDSDAPAAEPNTLTSEDNPKGFVQLQRAILFARNLSRDAKLLYAILQHYSWRDEHCFPGYDRLCFEMQAGETSVRKFMRELESVGLVTQRRRGQGFTNIYFLPSVKGAKLVYETFQPPEKPSKGAKSRTSESEGLEPRKSNAPEPHFSGAYLDSVDRETEDVDRSIRPASPAVNSDDAALILSYVTDFGDELHDTASPKASAARAAKLFREFGGEIGDFCGLMNEAKRRTQSHAPRKGTRMAYWFGVLESLVRDGR
jgi:hypothetical protein